MFQTLTLRGGAGAILWGYRTAAALRAWRIFRQDDGQWMLVATPARLDAFQCRQKPLLFTAPRQEAHDGFWAWGVESLDVGPNQLVAKLGPPEQ